MTEVRNRSRIAGTAYRVIRDAILELTHVDDLRGGANSIHPRLEIVRSFAYEDGTHDLIVTGSSVQLSFATTCAGEILSATLWDAAPTENELILDRLEGLNPGVVRREAALTCCIGGHEQRIKVG